MSWKDTAIPVATKTKSSWMDDAVPVEITKDRPALTGQGLADASETTIRSLLEGFTGGLSEPVYSGIQAGTRTLETAARDLDLSKLSLDELAKNYEMNVERRRQMKEQAPISNIGGQILGSLSPSSLLSRVGSAAGGAARSGVEAIGLGKAAPVGAGLLQRGASNLGKVVAGGAEGAATAGTAAAAQNAILEAGGFQKPGEGVSAGEAALFGGKLGAGLAAVPIVAKGALESGKYLGKRAITVTLGPSVENVETYLRRADAIKNAKSKEQIKDLIDDTMKGLFDDVESGVMNREQAKEAVKAIEGKIKDVTRDAQFDFRIAQADIVDQLKTSKAALDQALKVKTEALSAIKSPIQLADEVQTAVQDLKQKVVDGSNEAYDILGRSSQKVNLQKPFQNLSKIRGDLMIAGQAPVTPEAQQALSRLDELITRTGQLPVQMPASEAKKLVQQLDSAISYGRATGSFSDETQQALTSLRRGVDEQLKIIPEYSAKMKEVSTNADLLSKASKAFGTAQTSVGRLNKIASRTSSEDRKLLAMLGKSTGRDFDTPIGEFTKAQATLKDPRAMESIKRGLPEYKKTRLDEMSRATISRPETKAKFVESEISKRGLLAERAGAEKGLLDAEGKLMASKGRLAPFKSLSKGSTQGAVEGLLRNPKTQNIELRKKLEDLGKMSNQDFTQMIDDLRVANAFDAGNASGSRNVNFWALMSSVGGAAATGGAMAGGPGAAIGAVGGLIIDRFGPKIAQKILDGVLKMQGSPTIQKIQSMGLPADAEKYLMRSLIQNEMASN